MEGRDDSCKRNKLTLACIGCGSCATICPTGAINVMDDDGKRVICAKHAEAKTLQPN